MYDIRMAVLPCGTLRLTANNDARRELSEGWREHHDWDRQWSEVIGPFAANGALLTDAPILTDDMSVEGDGTRTIHGRTWWFPDYMIRDPLAELRTRGRVDFVGEG